VSKHPPYNNLGFACQFGVWVLLYLNNLKSKEREKIKIGKYSEKFPNVDTTQPMWCTAYRKSNQTQI
jgi:hypothetical protein